MPDSDRSKWLKNHGGLAGSIFGALLLVALVVWTSWLQQRELSNEATSRAAYYAERANDQIAIKCSSLTGQARTDCAHKENEAARKNQREEYDLYSQQVMALWTGVMGGMAVVGVSVSIVGVYLIWQTWTETKRTVAIAREIGRDQSRAYLHIEKAEIRYMGRLGLQRDDGIFPAFDVVFFIKNTGQTPAKWYEFEFTSRIIERVDETRKTISEVTVPAKRWGFVSRDDVQTVGANSFEILDQIGQVCEAPKRSIGITGTLAYETEFSEVRFAPFSFYCSGLSVQPYTLPIGDDEERRKTPIPMYRTRQEQG